MVKDGFITKKEVYGIIDVSKNLEADNTYISKEYTFATSTYVTKVLHA